MRPSAGRWTVSTLLVVLFASAPARADLIRLCELQWNRTALALAALICSQDREPQAMTVRACEAVLQQEFGSRGCPGTGPFATLAGASEGGRALGGELAAYTRDGLRDLPEASLAFAPYVARFSAAALAVALNLNGALLQETRPSWDELLKHRQGLQDRLADWKKKRNKESLSALVKTNARLAFHDGLARSSVRIGFGLMLGLALWFLVRRF